MRHEPVQKTIEIEVIYAALIRDAQIAGKENPRVSEDGEYEARSIWTAREQILNAWPDTICDSEKACLLAIGCEDWEAEEGCPRFGTVAA